MDLSGYAAIVILALVSVYVLQVCIRDFRRARQSGEGRPYLYVLGAALALGVIGLVLILVVFSIVRPFH